MRITSVELHPVGSSAVIECSFRDPTRQNPYNVKGITGLDADDIVPRAYQGSGSSALYNLMLVKREISILLELNPDHAMGQSNASLRDDVYKIIASSRKGKVDIQLKDGATVVAVITGHVRKLEASHFSKNPEVQITIKADEPFFKAPEEVSVNVVGLDPNLTIIDDDISTAPHGVKFELLVTADFPDFYVEDPDDDEWIFHVNPYMYGGFLEGDIIQVSSEYNEKDLKIVRAGIPVVVADTIMAGSTWPVVFPGETKFKLTDGAKLDWTSITYFPTFWGV